MQITKPEETKAHSMGLVQHLTKKWNWPTFYAKLTVYRIN